MIILCCRFRASHDRPDISERCGLIADVLEEEGAKRHGHVMSPDLVLQKDELVVWVVVNRLHDGGRQVD